MGSKEATKQLFEVMSASGGCVAYWSGGKTQPRVLLACNSKIKVN